MHDKVMQVMSPYAVGAIGFQAVVQHCAPSRIPHSDLFFCIDGLVGSTYGPNEPSSREACLCVSIEKASDWVLKWVVDQKPDAWLPRSGRQLLFGQGIPAEGCHDLTG